MKASLFLYLVRALYIRSASYSIGNKWYIRVRARASCFVEMKPCSLLPTGWSATPTGATLPPPLPLNISPKSKRASTCGRELSLATLMIQAWQSGGIFGLC